MITNFFLDNRIGGPHHHIKNVNEIGASKKIKFNYVTCGKSTFTKTNLTNLRFIFKAFFIFEVILNIIEIFILNYKKKIKKIFFVHGIYNIAPVIAGSLIGKKVFWFILETPSKFLISIYKILQSEY